MLEVLETAGVLQPQDDGTFELTEVAAGLFNYGMARARSADDKLTAVATALHETLPALQQLATLPESAGLDGEVRNRVTQELSVFFNAFSGLLARATEALKAEG